MSTLKFINVNKIYGNNYHAVYDFNLDVADKEFIVFVGPSGCGKSTTLRMIAGLEEISDGEIYIDDTLINTVPPKDRNIAMVFQSYALYPHMTVFDNMAFSLRLRKAYFPVKQVKVDDPEYIRKENELNEQYKEETLKGIEQIKESSKNLKKKMVSEKVKDFTYRQQKKYRGLFETLKDEYSVPVMTYDKDKVQALSNKIGLLQKETPVKQDKIDSMFQEIERIKAIQDQPLVEYRKYTKEEMAQKVYEAAEILGLEPGLTKSLCVSHNFSYIIHNPN